MKSVIRAFIILNSIALIIGCAKFSHYKPGADIEVMRIKNQLSKEDAARVIQTYVWFSGLSSRRQGCFGLGSDLKVNTETVTFYVIENPVSNSGCRGTASFHFADINTLEVQESSKFPTIILHGRDGLLVEGKPSGVGGSSGIKVILAALETLCPNLHSVQRGTDAQP